MAAIVVFDTVSTRQMNMTYLWKPRRGFQRHVEKFHGVENDPWTSLKIKTAVIGVELDACTYPKLLQSFRLWVLGSGDRCSSTDVDGRG